MRKIVDIFRTGYKQRNKNILVTKKVEQYLTSLSSSNIDQKLYLEFQQIVSSVDGSYQTPLNQLEFMVMLAKVLSVRKILEIGTFKGFTALYLHQNLPNLERITTCELSENNGNYAIELWKKFGAEEQIELVQGDAKKTLQAINFQDAEYDMIYIDADKKGYPEYYQLALSMCKKGGIILLDNMLWAGLVAYENTSYSHPRLLNQLNKTIYNDRFNDVAMIPAWDGLLIIHV